MKANNTAKRCFSALLALSIAVWLMFSSCSPGDESGVPDAPDVLTFTEPETFTSGSRGQFEVTVTGMSGKYLNLSPGISVELEIRTGDGKYYSLGDNLWEDGELVRGDSGSVIVGTVERQDGDSWAACGSVSNASPRTRTLIGYAFDTPPLVYGSFVHPYETEWNEQVLAVELDDYLPGHYRARVVAREYVPLWTEDTIPFEPLNGEDVTAFGGSNGEAEEEITFEFDIPQYGDDPIGVAAYTLTDRSGDNGSLAALDLLLYADGDTRYLQADTMKLEREENGAYRTVEDGITSDFPPTGQYLQWTRIAESNGEPAPRLIPISSIGLQNWDSGGNYRLSMTFAENEDGSGETYTLYLYLNFAETPE